MPIQAWSRNLRMLTLAALAAGLHLTSARPALAQNSSVTTVAGYEGADRTQRLTQGAKQEGTLMIYSSVPVEDLSALTEAFEKKYGIKANVWRSSSEGVLQRIVAESKAGRYEADIIATRDLDPEVEGRLRTGHPDAPTLEELQEQLSLGRVYAQQAEVARAVRLRVDYGFCSVRQYPPQEVFSSFWAETSMRSRNYPSGP